MANGGWYGTKEEWDRIEAPLKLLDYEINRFADRHGLNVTKNLKDWPERSLTWGHDVRCLMQIYLADQEKLTLHLWICASQDRANKRYWKREFLIHEATAFDVEKSLFETLESGKRQLDLWSTHPDELEFATELRI
jgi:hypothetical protein